MLFVSPWDRPQELRALLLLQTKNFGQGFRCRLNLGREIDDGHIGFTLALLDHQACRRRVRWWLFPDGYRRLRRQQGRWLGVRHGLGRRSVPAQCRVKRELGRMRVDLLGGGVDQVRLVLSLEGVVTRVLVVVWPWAEHDVLRLPVRYLQTLDPIRLQTLQIPGFQGVGALFVR